MTHDVVFEGLEPPESIRKLIQDRVERLNKETGGAALRAIVKRDEAYTVSMTLEGPGMILETSQASSDLQAGVEEAFAGIERQLAEYRAFFALVSPHLEQLRQFVRHMVRYFEAIGELGRGEVTAEDLVDGALVRAWRGFAGGSGAPRNIRSWLMRHAREELKAERRLGRFESERTVPIEENIPKTPPAEWVTTLGEEILYFYQADEDLKLEDVVPDLERPTPDQRVETAELRRCVRQTLGTMSDEWRRVFLLHYLVGLSTSQLARATGRPEHVIRAMVEQARQYLRQKLIESGCSIRRGEGAPNARTKAGGG